METIKINFGYFWPSFKKEDNFYTRLLSSKYKIEISEKPDFYFFTHAYNEKKDYLKYKCHRIFVGFENQRTDWRICDYALDSDFLSDNPRHKRFPIWASFNMQQLMMHKAPDLFTGKKNFCCMLVSNASAKERIDFFHKLSKYKKVDSAGRYLNNIGRSVHDKMDFIKNYKFVISFENSAYPGYTTEKLIEPMLSNSIPVYWGNPLVGKDFNTRSFINIQSSNDYEDAIEKIIELDNDENKYLELVKEPWFKNNHLPDEMTKQSVLEFFDFVIEDSRTKIPVAVESQAEQSNQVMSPRKKMKQILKKIAPLLKLYRFCFRKKNEFYNWYTIPGYEKKRKVILSVSKKYGCNSVFLETGTFMGDTVEYFKNYFERLYSIELSNELADKAKKRFSNDEKITIVQGDSTVELSKILQTIHTPCVFWLDGHYSNEFWAGDQYVITAKGEKQTPILEELKQIVSHPIKNHIILIDDARLFKGENDYPKISVLLDFTTANLPGHVLKVRTDIIRILPKS